ncbi:hypothetical protein SLA2020_378610 [Shorea laevis]
MQSTCSSIPLPSILIFLFTLIKLQTSFCAGYVSYSNCSQTFECGSIENVSYPFWGVNRTDYCGQPGFELGCQNDVPKIKMLNNTFRVSVSTQNSRFLRFPEMIIGKMFAPGNSSTPPSISSTLVMFQAGLGTSSYSTIAP